MRRGETHRHHDYEEKQTVVLDGEENHLTSSELSLKYGIAKTTIRDWRRAYKQHGLKGLLSKQQKRMKKNNVYTSDFRIAVVKDRLASNASYRDLGEKYNVNKSVVRYWVFKYMEKGEESLMENMTGKTPKGNYSRTPISKRQKKDINKEIYTELEHLRAEVAYLKKLNALAWDIDESRRKKKPR